MQEVYSVGHATSMMWWPVVVLSVVVAGIAWVVFAIGMVVEKADTMDRSERIAQLYGYTVCLIAIVVFIASVNAFVGSAFEYANPLSSEAMVYGFQGRALSSFEAFKATYDTTLPGESKPPPHLSDAELRQRYEALRSARIDSVRFDSAKTMTTSGILIVIATLLFILHWRWLRTRAQAAA